MRLRRGLLALLVSACIIQGAAKKPTRRGPAAPRVSAATRAAASRNVDNYLARTPKTPFAQPGALVPIFAQLDHSKSAPVHMLHFGDSHTAADEWTGGLRDLLKERFGDGGSGFSLAGHPFLGYRRFDAHGGGTQLWHSEGFRSANGDGFFGLGGISIATDQAGQSVYLDTDSDSIEIDYLQQPGGGTIALYDGDNRHEDISTDGELGPGFAHFQATPGPRRLTLKTLDSRPVRLFGWAADKSSGVTYEALGINGAEASVILRWNENMLASYVQRRNPGLIVLAYGTNEASDPNWTPESYQEMFSSLLGKLREMSPTATILVLGPTDRWWRNRGAWRVFTGIDGIIAAQKAACRDHGCAYWDARERMGGKGSMRDWVYAGLAQGDYVHFTSAGYRRLAAVLFADLMRQYELYGETRQDH
jgi:lysophospholipase L1-like esterase